MQTKHIYSFEKRKKQVDFPFLLCQTKLKYRRTKAEAEVDFILDYEGVLLPIEVKAADNTKAKSLHMFCNRFSPSMAVKTSMKNVGDNMDGQTRVWSIPLYAFFRLKDYISHEMGW